MSHISPTTIPERYLDLATKPYVAMLATILPNGTPQVTPIWFKFDGKHFTFNTAKGRLKAKAIQKNAYVALAILDPQNPYRYLQVRGAIVASNETEGRAHINELSQHYTGNAIYSFGPPDEVRIKYYMLPEHIQGMG
jgi:hypothetical protein